MAAKGRIHYDNQVPLIGTSLSASSAQSGSPVSWLRDQLRSKTWRSSVGWTIKTGFNRLLDFTEAGVTRLATIALGTYATGDAMAAAVQAAMNAAPGATNTYAVSYSAGTKKFTIQRASGTNALVLKWATGANPNISVGSDLGFNILTDDTGSTSYTSDSASYQSRHYVAGDFGGNLLVKSCIAINHNLMLGGLTPGTIVLYGDSTPVNMVSPGFIHLLAGNPDVQQYQTSGAGETARYWWLVFNDVQNPVGYSELGVWFLGVFVEPSVNYSIDYVETGQELSTQEYGASGSHFQVQRAIRRTWVLNWVEILSADVALLRAFRDACPQGQNFFFGSQPDVTPEDIVYMFRSGESTIGLASSPNYTNVSFPVSEALAG